MPESTLSVDITTNNASLVSGMQKAEDSMQKFGKKAKDTSVQFDQEINNMANKASGFADKLQGAFSGNILGVGLGAAGLSGIVALMDGIATKAREIRKEAQVLGITIGQLRGLKMFAKDDWEEMNSGLQRASRLVGEAASGSKEAQKTFQELGLDWADLATSSEIEQVRKYADKLHETDTTMQRNAVSAKLFGRGMAELGTKLAEGREELDKFQKKAEGMDAFDKSLQMMGDSIKYWKEQAREAFENIAGPAVSLIEGPFQGNNQAQIDKANALAMAAKTKEQEIAAAKAKAVQGDVNSLVDSLRDETATLHMGADAWTLFKLKMQGATDEQIAQVEQMQKTRDEVKKFADDWKEAARIIESIKGPEQKLADELENINRLLNQNQLAWWQAAGAAADAMAKTIKTDKPQKSDLPQALQKGSVEAASAIARVTSGTVAEQQLAEQKRANRFLEKIAAMQKRDIWDVQNGDL